MGSESDDSARTYCEVCARSKGTKLPYSGTRPRVTRFLENVHVDLSGIIRSRELDHEMYFIMFFDDFSLFRHIYSLSDKTKEKGFKTFRHYIALSERQTGGKLKQFTMDRGSDFPKIILGCELRILGIVLHLTAPHTPVENVYSERGNRTVNTKARSMMLEAHAPLMFCFEACQTVMFLVNRTVTSALPEKITLFEKWHGRSPSIRHLRVWGCQEFSWVRKELWNSNFSPVGQEGMLVGFEDKNFNYHIYNFKSRKVTVTHHASFNKNTFPYQEKMKGHADYQAPQISPVVTQFFNNESDSESLVETNQVINESRTDEVETTADVTDQQVNQDGNEESPHNQISTPTTNNPTTKKMKSSNVPAVSRRSLRVACKPANRRGLMCTSEHVKIKMGVANLSHVRLSSSRMQHYQRQTSRS